MPKKLQKVSFVFPVFNEESNIEPLYQKVKQMCVESHVDYEMVFVDDGSTDNSLEIIKRLGVQDKNVVFISLSRNFGHQNAIFAGMKHATGDALITMDTDLQHPPSLIPKMIDLWRKGAEVVYTTKEERSLKFWWRMTIKIFYWFFSKISRLQLSFGQSDFRLLDKKVLQVILQIPEYHKFLRGQVSWVGFTQQGLSYDVEGRYSGKSKFSFRKRFPFAMDGIFAFSRYPLHLLMLFGLLVAGVSFLYIFFHIILWILIKTSLVQSWPMPSGWITLAVSILFLGSMQLIAIGVLGEYVGRTFDQTKGRPVFIIKEASVQSQKMDENRGFMIDKP